MGVGKRPPDIASQRRLETARIIRDNGGTYMPMDDKIAVAERDAMALQLRAAGAPYRVIAERLGWAGAQGAHEAVKRALAAIPAEPAAELRRIELERLEKLQVSLWRLATSDEVSESKFKATDRLLKVMEMRAKITGLWTENVAVSGVIGHVVGTPAGDGAPAESRKIVVVYENAPPLIPGGGSSAGPAAPADVVEAEFTEQETTP